MDISYDEGKTVIVLEKEELEPAIRTVEFLLAVFHGCDTSEVDPILAMMKSDAGMEEESRDDKPKNVREPRRVYH